MNGVSCQRAKGENGDWENEKEGVIGSQNIVESILKHILSVPDSAIYAVPQLESLRLNGRNAGAARDVNAAAAAAVSAAVQHFANFTPEFTL